MENQHFFCQNIGSRKEDTKELISRKNEFDRINFYRTFLHCDSLIPKIDFT